MAMKQANQSAANHLYASVVVDPVAVDNSVTSQPNNVEVPVA